MIRKRPIFLMITLEVFALTMMVPNKSFPLDCLLILLSVTFPSLQEPQYSVLGPILFLIYNNDITDIFFGPIYIKLYADDTQIYNSIRCPDDSSLIQSCVNSLTE